MGSQRILIVAVDWLGDLLFMTPAIRSIRRAHPDSHIACLVAPRGLDLLAGNPHLDELIAWQEGRGAAGWLRIFPLARRLRAGRFDTCFLFHRSFSRTLAAWLAGIPSRVGYRTWKRGWLLTTPVDPPAKDSVHKAEWFLRLVGAGGIVPAGRQYDAGILPEDTLRAEEFIRGMRVAAGEPVVALHAGANWKLKRWPPGHFARLADALAERYGARVLFVGGPEDIPLIRGIAGRMRTEPLVAAGRTTFRQMGALLARTRLLISNDSGPLHMGIAAGVPVVALFGPTRPELTGPPEGAKAVTLFGSIGCPVPCYRLHCPANLCMGQISVEQVLEAAGKFLS
ncbi:MAG: lipopolysaccharide heptosyltransferase II [Candidatus Omnitrophica bacterium]|nr:lipopolysaccharide heptosyltransferase II [Candidatus Omnitrophota bacterium]